MKAITLISGGDSGRAKTHTHSLLQNLSRAIEAAMVYFLEGPLVQEARELGTPTVVLSGRNPLCIYRTLKRMIREGGYQPTHYHGAHGSIMGALLRRSTSLSVITTVHSDCRLNYLGRLLSRLIYDTIDTIALCRLDYRIGVSDAMTGLLIERGSDPDRLLIIYNGIDFTPRIPVLSREEYFRSVGLETDGDSVVVGAAARLNPVKDIAILVWGFTKVHQECPSLRLLIVGDGKQMFMLKGFTAELGVECQVCFAGWVSDTDSFYHAVDINTPTSLSETFPYSLTKGVRAALPTIASRVGGVPYLIEHGVHGPLFKVDDADTLARHLITLAGDPTLRQYLEERFYQRGREDFSLESTLEHQLNIYKTILYHQSRKRGRRDGALVCGVHGRGNAGNDATLETIVTELCQIDPDLPIRVFSCNLGDTRLAYRVNSIYIFAFPRFLWWMRKTRLYINDGGSLMQDVTSHRSLRLYLFIISWVKWLGNQVIMYGCGIGPTHSPASRRRVSRVLQKSVNAITLRDTHSAEKLEDMGVTKLQVIPSADLTVTLPATPAQMVNGILENQGINPHGRYAGFALRPWPGFKAKAAVFGTAADYAYETYGLTSVFLPIGRRLDVGVAQLAAQHMKALHYILFRTDRSDHIIGLFTRMQAVVSMRFHALVLSAGQGVPLMGVVYDQKISSLLSYIGQDLYTGLDEVAEEAPRVHIDAACARIGDEVFLSSGVERLRQVERRNSGTARMLSKR